ncbi:MAG: response regulator [Anaerolineales bacterium]
MIGEPVRVLLVEDNDDHAELVMRQLADHRIANQVTRLVDGQAALDYLFRNGEYENPKHSPAPHVILLDLRLPKVDGLEVLKSLKESEELRDIPVVVLTTSETEKDIAKAYINHANSYIVKPVDYEKFRLLMNDLGFYWMSWNTKIRK